MDTVFLNDEFIPMAHARICPLDRGFLFADAVYEVVPVYEGKPFLLDAHLARLSRSLEAIRLDAGKTQAQWTDILNQLLAYNTTATQLLYIQVTRGVQAQRFAPFPKHYQPTLFVMSQPVDLPDIAEWSTGCQVITTDDTRWQHCHIKTTNLLANCMARTEATDKGVSEAILLSDGQVREGTNSNVFVVKNRCIKTPPTADNILPGITRQYVIDIARKNQFPVAQTTLTLHDLYHADEVWITSAGRAIKPVIQVDEYPVGTGKTGPVWRQLIDYFMVDAGLAS